MDELKDRRYASYFAHQQASAPPRCVADPQHLSCVLQKLGNVIGSEELNLKLVRPPADARDPPQDRGAADRPWAENG
jgi:hypothetical protein